MFIACFNSHLKKLILDFHASFWCLVMLFSVIMVVAVLANFGGHVDLMFVDRRRVYHSLGGKISYLGTSYKSRTWTNEMEKNFSGKSREEESNIHVFILCFVYKRRIFISARKMFFLNIIMTHLCTNKWSRHVSLSCFFFIRIFYLDSV